MENASGDVETADVAPGDVRGLITGTEVVLGQSSYGRELSIYAEGGWGSSPSLLIFLFLGDGESPEGRTFVVDPDGVGSNPHVHYRWRDPASEKLEVESVMRGYDMTLEFGAIEGDELPGSIAFSVPGDSTRVEGTFRATVKPTQ